MSANRTKDEADAAVEQQVQNLDDAESLFMAIRAVATKAQMVRLHENLAEIASQRALMQSCGDIFAAARSAGV